MKKMINLFRRKKPMPLPETLGDCVLLQAMGYQVRFEDGRPTAVEYVGKKKSLIGCSRLSSKS